MQCRTRPCAFRASSSRNANERAGTRRPVVPPLEVRVGSATNALEPIPGAQRSLAAGPAQWAALLVVAGAAAAADQLTKLVVAGALALGDSVQVLGPLSIHRVRNTGIAFGLFSDATSVVSRRFAAITA